MGNDNASPALARFKSAVQIAHVPLGHEIRGQSFMWDGVQVDFLWPDSAADPDAPSAKNNDSLVVRLKYGDRTILLPGDAENQAEYKILSENETAGLHSDVLKVGHHGSKNSAMPEFLAAVAPQIGIISAGEQNPYGHPSAELLGRLRESGVRILRTDGHDLKVSCFVACPIP
jgi:competence protein ComEC